MCVCVLYSVSVCVPYCVCACTCASHTLECQVDSEHLSIKDELEWVSLGPALLKRASLVAQMVKNLLTIQEIWVQSLGREDLPEKEMATPSSIPAWRIPWMEEPGGWQSMGSQRVGHNWATNTFTFHYLKSKLGHPTVAENFRETQQTKNDVLNCRIVFRDVPPSLLNFHPSYMKDQTFSKP